MINASVIISFYNRIDYLRLVFAGFERQTSRNFEIIIADDGSKGEVIKEIEIISKKIPFKLNNLNRLQKLICLRFCFS